MLSQPISMKQKAPKYHLVMVTRNMHQNKFNLGNVCVHVAKMILESFKARMTKTNTSIVIRDEKA